MLIKYTDLYIDCIKNLLSLVNRKLYDIVILTEPSIKIISIGLLSFIKEHSEGDSVGCPPTTGRNRWQQQQLSRQAEQGF